jgi:hypothetical protein
MKRVALSVIGGVAIPFIYSIIVGPLSTYTENDTVHWLIYVPIGWPKLVLYYLVSLNSFPFRDEDATVLLLYIIACDILLYAFVTYLFLLALLRPKKVGPPSPPNPPIGQASR